VAPELGAEKVAKAFFNRLSTSTKLFVHTEDQEQTTYSEGGSMAREPERKLVEVTFRCLDEEGFSFRGKMEYVGHEIKEPGGGTRIGWRQNQSRANCPHDPFHSIELVED
jgi:hypothetical protein